MGEAETEVLALAEIAGSAVRRRGEAQLVHGTSETRLAMGPHETRLTIRLSKSRLAMGPELEGKLPRVEIEALAEERPQDGSRGAPARLTELVTERRGAFVLLFAEQPPRRSRNLIQIHDPDVDDASAAHEKNIAKADTSSAFR